MLCYFILHVFVAQLGGNTFNLFCKFLLLKVRLDWTRSNAKQREAKVGDLRQPSRVVANLRDS